jgi:hypothetical protein
LEFVVQNHIVRIDQIHSRATCAEVAERLGIFADALSFVAATVGKETKSAAAAIGDNSTKTTICPAFASYCGATSLSFEDREILQVVLHG